MSKLISAKNLVKTYFIGEENEFNALNDIDLEIDEHEFVAIVGQSGSGKSTLMNIIGALDKPTKGSYLFQGTDFSKLSDSELSTIRNKSIGFVFQTFNLVSRISALKNVEMPMLYAGVPARVIPSGVDFRTAALRQLRRAARRPPALLRETRPKALRLADAAVSVRCDEYLTRRGA